MLFAKRFHAGLRDGSIRLTFRLWSRPQVAPGKRYRVKQLGLLEVDAIAKTRADRIAERDARRAGFASTDELRDYLARVTGEKVTGATTLYRIELHYAGEDDRLVLGRETKGDLDAIATKLDRMDARRARPWAWKTLALIDEHPRVVSTVLAEKLGEERFAFKLDVRKLKALGLTISHDVGYELSKRGKALLALKRSR